MCGSANGVDKLVGGLNAVQVDKAVEDDVQGLKGDERLVEHLAVEVAGGNGVEGGNATSELGADHGIGDERCPSGVIKGL